MKKQAIEWKKIFQYFNTYNDKGLVCGTYKELLQIDKRMTNNPINIGQRFEQTLNIKRGMTSKHMKNVLNIMVHQGNVN